MTGNVAARGRYGSRKDAVRNRYGDGDRRPGNSGADDDGLTAGTELVPAVTAAERAYGINLDTILETRKAN